MRNLLLLAYKEWNATKKVESEYPYNYEYTIFDVKKHKIKERLDVTSFIDAIDNRFAIPILYNNRWCLMFEEKENSASRGISKVYDVETKDVVSLDIDRSTQYTLLTSNYLDLQTAPVISNTDLMLHNGFSTFVVMEYTYNDYTSVECSTNDLNLLSTKLLREFGIDNNETAKFDSICFYIKGKLSDMNIVKNVISPGVVINTINKENLKIYYDKTLVSSDYEKFVTAYNKYLKDKKKE